MSIMASIRGIIGAVGHWKEKNRFVDKSDKHLLGLIINVAGLCKRKIVVF